MNNLSDFPGIFHFNSMFFPNFFIQTGKVATLVGKTTFSPLVWPCFQFSSKKLKNIEFQWKKLENQLRLLFYLVVTHILRNIQVNKYHFQWGYFLLPRTTFGTNLKVNYFLQHHTQCKVLH